MAHGKSKRELTEATIEDAVAPFRDRLPPDALDLMRDELRALIKLHPGLSALVAQGAKRIQHQSGAAGDDEDDDVEDEQTGSGGA